MIADPALLQRSVRLGLTTVFLRLIKMIIVPLVLQRFRASSTWRYGRTWAGGRKAIGCLSAQLWSRSLGMFLSTASWHRGGFAAAQPPRRITLPAKDIVILAPHDHRGMANNTFQIVIFSLFAWR